MPSNLQPILFLVAIAAVFYLLMIRPQQKKKREMQAMLQSLRPGIEVVTTAGLYGRVVAMEGDDTLLIEVAPGVTCKYLKQAVMRVVPEVTGGPPEQESLSASSFDGQRDSDSTADEPAAETDGTAKSDKDDSSGESGAADGDRRSSS